MISVVLDTNVLVSAVLSPQGPPARVLQAAAEGVFRTIVSPAIVAEYRSVLGRAKFGLSSETVERIVSGLERIAVSVAPTESLSASKDPADEKFLECAAAAGASHLVTGNQKHFPKSFRGIRVVSPARFLRAAGL